MAFPQPPGGPNNAPGQQDPTGGDSSLEVVPDYMKASSDGNFKRGKWIIPVILVVAAGAIAVVLYFVFKKEGERLTAPDAAKAKQDIYLLPRKEQAPEWRKWAASSEPLMAQEALTQLALMDDEKAVELAANALKSGDHKITAVAAQVVAHFGTPGGDGARAALLEALKSADASDEPQIVWALVTLKEASVFDKAMALYKAKDAPLASVQRVGGGKDFEAKKLAALMNLDDFAAKFAGDPSDAVRQLVATVLSENPNPKYVATLSTLVADKNTEVGKEAAVGLGKIADDSARAPLLKALTTANESTRVKFLDALTDGIGGEGLVLALDSVDHSKPDKEWGQIKVIFERIKKLSDPRAGDALVHWVDTAKPHPHWVGEVGMRLAEIGDIRGATYLAQHIKDDPKTIYKKENIWESDSSGLLSEGDFERMANVRMLADLAAIHPEKGKELVEIAGPAVREWTKARLQPSASALRFFANTKDPEMLKQIRAWAFPKDPLPKLGETGHFPDAFVIAQSALRYVGAYKDADSFDKLVKMFDIKETIKDPTPGSNFVKNLDLSYHGMENGGKTVTGFCVRAVQYGAADGLSELGDPKAAKPLMEFIEDKLLHEEARTAACQALAFASDEAIIKDVAARALKFSAMEKEADQWIGACYATTLAQSSHPQDVASLIDFIKPEMNLEVQAAIAQAVGASPLDDASVAKLRELMKIEGTRNAAALALVMGGNEDVAAQTIAAFGNLSQESMDSLKSQYFRAFGFWSDVDLQRKNIFRWVDNAESIGHVKVREAWQHWAIERLSDQFDNLVFDNGPHSQTRPVLRYQLVQMAKTGDDATKAEAIRTLKFMREQGSLMALRKVEGVTGELAEKAFKELMNPIPIEKMEDVKKLQEEQAKKMRKDN
ncbi:MAG: HEAT repeat domain-containing protein [Polyangiaceae bacterium]